MQRFSIPTFLVALRIRISAFCDTYVRFFEPTITSTGRYLILLPEENCDKIHLKNKRNPTNSLTKNTENKYWETLDSTSIEFIETKDLKSIVFKIYQVKRNNKLVEIQIKNFLDIVNYKNVKNKDLIEQKVKRREQKLKI